MVNLLTQKLVSLIQESSTPEMLPVAFLMEVLSLGKEASYRRLRGDVPFTFEEMIKISQRLEVSLDEIANASVLTNKSKWATIDLDTLYLFSTNYAEQYYENIARFKEVYNEMIKSGSSTLRYAGSSIPFSMILGYKKLALFRHYKRMYLSQETNRTFTFHKMVVPEIWREFEKQFVTLSRKIPRTVFILDRNIFVNLVKDIIYFFKEDLITSKEVLELKTELLDLLVYMENLAKRGSYDTGKELNIYLADVDIDAAYAHMECNDTEYAVNVLYFIDILVYQNTRMCHKQKKWIDLLKKFSTHITQTGEKERFDFFSKQRDMIENIL